MAGEKLSRFGKFKKFVKDHPLIFTFLLLGIVALIFFTGGAALLPLLLPVAIKMLVSGVSLFFWVGIGLIFPLSLAALALTKSSDHPRGKGYRAKENAVGTAAYCVVSAIVSLASPLGGFILCAVAVGWTGLVLVYKGCQKVGKLIGGESGGAGGPGADDSLSLLLPRTQDGLQVTVNSSGVALLPPAAVIVAGVTAPGNTTANTGSTTSQLNFAPLTPVLPDVPVVTSSQESSPVMINRDVFVLPSGLASVPGAGAAVSAEAAAYRASDVNDGLRIR